MTAVLLSFGTAVALAHAGGLPSPALAVPGVVFAFTLARRPGGEPPRETLAAAVLFCALAGASAWLGPQLSRHPVVSGAVFVAFMGGSVWARRFGAAAARLGAMAPAVALACLIAAPAAAVGPWWPRCGWTALVGLSAFGWVGTVRWLGRRLTGLPGPRLRPAPAGRANPRAGMPASTRMAVQTTLALAIALTAGHLLFGAHWQWCAISVMVVNIGTAGRGDLALKGIERALGAMAGTIVATALPGTAQPHGSAAIATIFVLLALASGVRQYSYAVYACCVTAVLSVLYGYFGESAQDLLPIRLGALSLGAAIAVTIGWFLLPVRARDVVRARLASALAALSAVLEARRTGSAVSAALTAFDAAAESAWASARPHRLHRAVLRLIRTPGDAHPADIGDALREARVSVRAMAAAAGPRERATAAAIGSLRRALADPAAPLPCLPEPAHQGPLDGVDAALRQAAAAIPALRPPASRRTARAGARRRDQGGGRSGRPSPA
jgi:hypothetical protein